MRHHRDYCWHRDCTDVQDTNLLEATSFSPREERHPTTTELRRTKTGKEDEKTQETMKMRRRHPRKEWRLRRRRRRRRVD